jgi:hypothetical protein
LSSASSRLVFGPSPRPAHLSFCAEYKRNWSFHGSATKMALRSALVAFVFFVGAIVAVAIFRMVA